MKDNELELKIDAVAGEADPEQWLSVEQIKALTALCRSFAASELRTAAGENENIHKPLFKKEPIGSWINQEAQSQMIGRNELRRTLRQRAEELETGE